MTTRLLTPREFEVFSLWSASNDVTLQAVGNVVGITRERVRQILHIVQTALTTNTPTPGALRLYGRFRALSDAPFCSVHPLVILRCPACRNEASGRTRAAIAKLEAEQLEKDSR